MSDLNGYMADFLGDMGRTKTITAAGNGENAHARGNAFVPPVFLSFSSCVMIRLVPQVPLSRAVTSTAASRPAPTLMATSSKGRRCSRRTLHGATELCSSSSCCCCCCCLLPLWPCLIHAKCSHSNCAGLCRWGSDGTDPAAKHTFLPGCTLSVRQQRQPHRKERQLSCSKTVPFLQTLHRHRRRISATPHADGYQCSRLLNNKFDLFKDFFGTPPASNSSTPRCLRAFSPTMWSSGPLFCAAHNAQV